MLENIQIPRPFRPNCSTFQIRQRRNAKCRYTHVHTWVYLCVYIRMCAVHIRVVWTSSGRPSWSHDLYTRRIGQQYRRQRQLNEWHRQTILSLASFKSLAISYKRLFKMYGKIIFVHFSHSLRSFSIIRDTQGWYCNTNQFFFDNFLFNAILSQTIFTIDEFEFFGNLNWERRWRSQSTGKIFHVFQPISNDWTYWK